MARWYVPSPSKSIAPRAQSATVAGAWGIRADGIALIAGG